MFSQMRVPLIGFFLWGNSNKWNPLLTHFFEILGNKCVSKKPCKRRSDSVLNGKWEYQNKPCYLENCHYVASLEKPKTLIQPFFLVWMGPGLNIGRGHYRSATQITVSFQSMEILKKSVWRIWQHFSYLLDEEIPEIWKKLNFHDGFLN